MRGYVVEVTVYDGMLAFAHKSGMLTRRLVVPYDGREIEIVSDFPDRKEVRAHNRDGITEDEKVIQDVDVPDDLVELALRYIQTHEELCKRKQELYDLIGHGPDLDQSWKKYIRPLDNP